MPDQYAEYSELRFVEARTLDAWLTAVVARPVGVLTEEEIKQSLSWRVSRPLRLAGIVLSRLREVGPRRTWLAIRDRLARGRAARRRG